MTACNLDEPVMLTDTAMFILENCVSWTRDLEHIAYLISAFAFRPIRLKHAIKKGSIDLVKYLSEHDLIEFTTDAMDLAAEHVPLEIVKYLHDNRSEGCATAAMDGAAKNGHLAVVKYIHVHRSEGCTTDAMDEAAAHGYVRVVKFLHENRSEGCTAVAMTDAAIANELNVIKFLHKHRTEGCLDSVLEDTAATCALKTIEFICVNRMEGCVRYAYNWVPDEEERTRLHTTSYTDLYIDAVLLEMFLRLFPCRPTCAYCTPF